MSLSAGDQLGVAAGCLAAMFILFVGLAELCDEWLVPWLEVIQKKTGMSDDLAGVTLVAFGSAAPELMISMVTVLSGDTDVSATHMRPNACLRGAKPPPASSNVMQVYYAAACPACRQRAAHAAQRT